MLISEIYASRQGEGLLTGTPSIFVRASGCNLRCWFCDTPYTSWEPEGVDLSLDAIIEEVNRLSALGWDQDARHLQAHQTELDGGPAVAAASLSDWTQSGPARQAGSTRHVVVTGGEPMLFAELIPLTRRLREAGFHITIETAGTLFLPVECDLMSISPKLANSTPSSDRAGPWAARHERTRHQPEVIRRLTDSYGYQLKFVIDTRGDLPDVDSWLAEFPQLERGRVLLMPQGTDSRCLDAIGQWLAPHCSEHGFVFCPRKHIDWYGARRGT